MSRAPRDRHEVQAFNTASASENKIHDNDVAQRFGFGGGLVPGVDVYAYMTRAAVRRWGRAWLERGTMDCRFGKPLYDGEVAAVTATEADAGLMIEVESPRETCAHGTAGLPSAADPPRPAEGFAAAPAPGADRPPASEESLPEGRLLASHPIALTPEVAEKYLRDVREDEPLYAEERLAHPGFLLRLCNRVLSDNVTLGPWMHVGSVVRHLRVARVGQAVSARARVSRNYEHKGHRFVVLDAVVLAGGRPVARASHTAIWLPRQLAAA